MLLALPLSGSLKTISEMVFKGDLVGAGTSPIGFPQFYLRDEI
jgi:hypothetical protein